MTDPVPESDADLVRQCLAGDTAAMQSLVERYQRDVFGLCVRLLTNRHDAEDATQEVFIRIFRSLKKWDRTRPLRPWITTIAINRCRTWISKRMSKPRPTTLLEDVAEVKSNEPDGRELPAAVQNAVDVLREEHKTVFVLFHERGQNYEEIAEAVGRPVGTVKTWLHRARATVLEQLKRAGLVNDENMGTES